MSKYYFITTLLPPLQIGQAPELPSSELDFLLKMNLTEKDYKDVEVLRRYIDIQNIRHFWRNEPLEEGGNVGQKEIEEALLHAELFPPYVFSFMETYPRTEQRLEHFSLLLRDFFRYEIAHTSHFVQDYLRTEWEKRLVFTALRAKNLKRSLQEEFKLEDPEDPFIQHILEQEDSDTYEPPARYAVIKTLYEEYKSNPLKLFRALLELDFEYINDVIGWHTFDTKNVLGYVVQLRLVEQSMKLDQQKGLAILEKIVKK
jgi:hypothetical protein